MVIRFCIRGESWSGLAPPAPEADGAVDAGVEDGEEAGADAGNESKI